MLGSRPKGNDGILYGTVCSPIYPYIAFSQHELSLLIYWPPILHDLIPLTFSHLTAI